MSRIEKLLQKFERSPQSVRYADIERILSFYNFDKIPAKGSHTKWKHKELNNDLIIPVHNNECKKFYKVLAYKQLKNLKKVV